MKKKQTNTLGSWIDQAEMKRLMKALAPDDPESGGDREEASTEDFSSIGLSKRHLDIDQPGAYNAAPFPPPSARESMDEPMQQDEEGPVLRAARALAEVRLRADENGFLKRRGRQLETSESQTLPVLPVFNSDPGFVENAPATRNPSVNADFVPFEIPRGPLRERLDAFATWAVQLTDASRMVIVDGQGYPLLHRDSGERDVGGDSAIVDSAMRLTSVLEQVQTRADFARDGALNLPLEGADWLGVMRCESAGGRLCVAMVTPGPLEIEKSTAVKRELWRTMEATA